MKHAREILLVTLLTFLVPFVRAYEMRTWTAMNGKTTEAAYVKYESDTQKVVMQKRDGTIIKVNREALSDNDWIYVSQFDSSILLFSALLGQVPAVQIFLPNLGKRHGGTRIGFSNLVTDQTVSSIRKQSSNIEKSLSFSYMNDGMLQISFGGSVITSIPYPDRFWDVFESKLMQGYYTSALFTSTDDQIGEKRYSHPSKGLSKILCVDYALWCVIKGFHSPYSKLNSDEQFTLLFVNSDWKTTTTSYLDTDNADVKIFLVRNLAQNTLRELAVSRKKPNAKLMENPRYKRISALLEAKSHGVPNDTSLPGKSLQSSNLRGTGSGFFISSDGYFLTNYHVVQGSKNIRLRTVFGNTSASVLRVDPGVDLALLKADKRGFVPLPFATEDLATLGEDIFTIGFPIPSLQGFSPKMTKGVISSLNGFQDSDVHYQIDASIQPGNSGGPLVNNQGELVGVIVSSLDEGIVAQKKGFFTQNVNYAIKKKHVLDFLSQVPECLSSIQKSNIPSTGKSATPETIEAVQNSCAMVIVFE